MTHRFTEHLLTSGQNSSFDSWCHLQFFLVFSSELVDMFQLENPKTILFPCEIESHSPFKTILNFTALTLLFFMKAAHESVLPTAVT